MKIRNTQIIIEQIALLFASFVWTTIVLTGIVFFWAYQDVQARWDYVLNAPPEALAAADALPTPTPLPSPTPWAGPGATLTPTPTQPPTPTPTRVIPEPDLLPETLNPGDPTPIPVIVHTQDETQELGVALEQTSTQPAGSVTNAAQPAPGGPAAAPPPVAEQSPPAIVASLAGVPTRLVIPSVGIDSEVIPVGWAVIERNGQEYSVWQVADFAVGWHETSAVLGQPGNTVMAGHHNVNGEVFRDLVNVEVGDKVTAYSGGQVFEYVVEMKTIVKEKGEPVEVRRKNAEWIAPSDDERLTFVTCWPYTNNTHRVIVVAKPVA
jgi:sortase A